MTETAAASQARRRILSLRASVLEVVQNRYFVPVCLTAAFVIRMCWISSVNAQPVSDFRWYYERGVDFAAGRGYSVGSNAFWPDNLPPAALEYPTNGRPTAYWPVGYPAFLGLLFAVFGPSLYVARVANVILYLGVLFLSYSLARRLFNSEFTARITLLILAFYPNHIAYTSLISSEILLLFLLLLGIMLLFVPGRRLWLAPASGAVFGLACLVKPQVILIPALFFITSLMAYSGRKRLLDLSVLTVTVYVSIGITILPWIVRNYNVFDAFVFISNNGGINLLVGNNPDANGGYCCHPQIASMLGDIQDEHDRDVRARAIAIEYIVRNPGETIKRVPSKFWHLYGADREAVSRNEQGLSPTQGTRRIFFLFKALAQLYYVLIMVTFLLSIIIFFIQRRHKTNTQPLPTIGLWIILYLTCVYLLMFGYSRFHFPVIPWVVMYVGVLVEVLTGPRTRSVKVRPEDLVKPDRAVRL